MQRYGGFETLYDAIDEGGMETVLVNLSDDLNYKYTYEEIIELIERLWNFLKNIIDVYYIKDM